MHYTYLVECRDHTFYIGYTNNLDKRIKTHNEGKGAKYTRGRLPVILRYYEEYESKTEAMKREYELKKLTRKKKEELIKTFKKDIQRGM
ncbi:MAG: GIY-YIG nuclease family protein [Lachnospiraceae bacterium]